MNVLTLKRLSDFWAINPDAETPLRAWYKHVRSAEYATFAEVRADFGSADWAGGYIIFNIGGNKYRLIIFPNFQGKRFHVETVLTHAEYDHWRP